MPVTQIECNLIVSILALFEKVFNHSSNFIYSIKMCYLIEEKMFTNKKKKENLLSSTIYIYIYMPIERRRIEINCKVSAIEKVSPSASYECDYCVSTYTFIYKYVYNATNVSYVGKLLHRATTGRITIMYR